MQVILQRYERAKILISERNFKDALPHMRKTWSLAQDWDKQVIRPGDPGLDQEHPLRGFADQDYRATIQTRLAECLQGVEKGSSEAQYLLLSVVSGSVQRTTRTEAAGLLIVIARDLVSNLLADSGSSAPIPKRPQEFLQTIAEQQSLKRSVCADALHLLAWLYLTALLAKKELAKSTCINAAKKREKSIWTRP